MLWNDGRGRIFVDFFFVCVNACGVKKMRDPSRFYKKKREGGDRSR